MASKRPEVLLLVGMSGAGRSSSSNVFEDLGYYVIENLPADLVESVVNSNDLVRLKNLGNTVLVVEHDENTLEKND